MFRLKFKRIIKSVKDDISHGHALIVSGMLFLIFAQLIWWLIFFEINQKRTLELFSRYHTLFGMALSGNINGEDYGDLIIRKENGAYEIRREIPELMQEEHKKYLIMLISETAFTLIIISYGSFRVIRSLRREKKLVNERNMFMNSVSHELKTPLSTILLNLQTLLKHPELADQEKNEMIHEGIEGVRRLEEQVNNLLLGGEILRNKNNHQSHSLRIIEDCDAAKVAHKYLKDHEIYFKNHDVKLSAHIPESLPVHISGDFLYKVLSNLISNAVQYSGNNPQITLTIEKENNGSVLLSVSDCGQGIPEDELHNIFKPLYRLEKKSSSIRGTGMGLYIVREIITSCDGSIRAFSSPDNGTRFEVRLPFAG